MTCWKSRLVEKTPRFFFSCVFMVFQTPFIFFLSILQKKKNVSQNVSKSNMENVRKKRTQYQYSNQQILQAVSSYVIKKIPAFLLRNFLAISIWVWHNQFYLVFFRHGDRMLSLHSYALCFQSKTNEPFDSNNDQTRAIVRRCQRCRRWTWILLVITQKFFTENAKSKILDRG